MDKNIKISVIIPAYNAAKTILQCIESVLNQTVSVFEIIVIDDGSLDETEIILINYKENHLVHNLELLKQVNGGPSKARNLGITNSKGNWLAFLDADDRWLPTKIEKQFEFLQMYPDYLLIGTLFYPHTINIKSKFKTITFKSMLLKDSLFTSTVLVEKQSVSQFLFDENQRYSEDYKLWLQITQHKKAAVLNDGLVIYAENQHLNNLNSLSKQLWKMEKGELSNFLFLYKTSSINLYTLLITSIYSLFRFSRRVMMRLIRIK